MSNCQNKKTVKKTKLDEVDEDVCSVEEYKRFAILKYCNENGIKKHQINRLFFSNDIHILGLCYF